MNRACGWNSIHPSRDGFGIFSEVMRHEQAFQAMGIGFCDSICGGLPACPGGNNSGSGFQRKRCDLHMMPGMISDQMPFIDHSYDKVGRVLQIVSYKKKTCRSLVFLQRIKYRLCIAVLESRIKGKIDHGLFGVTDKKCVILAQFFYRCHTGWWLPVIFKG